MLTLSSREALFTALQQQASVITPNNRLSNQLLQDFFKSQQTAACVKPHCLPYQAYLQDLFQQARFLYAHQNHPILLNAQQEYYLWHHIVAQSGHAPHAGMLQEIQNAYTRCQAWQINIDDPAFNESPQKQLFYHWSQAFNQALAERGAITTAQLASHLLDYPEIIPKVPLVWVCFDEFSPQQRALQAWFSTNHVIQYSYDLAAQATETFLYAAEDTQDEQLQMITWLKQQLTTGKQRIGIVIPDLQTQAKPLQRLLESHLDSALFNISLGQPFTAYPLAAHALEWLNLQDNISHHALRLLLDSPYLAGANTEYIARAELIQNKMDLQQPTLPLKVLINSIRYQAPILASKLTELHLFPEQATPQQWAHHFKTRLTQLGFPGEQSLTSEQYQCMQRLWLLFDEFLALSIIQPILSQKEALEALQHLAMNTIFQMKTSIRPIQILGLLEANGCNFDSLWVCGLTDICLPQPIRLSAFIPIQIQRQYQMPRAIPLKELQFARQWLQRFQYGSKLCIFSYSRFIGDTPQLPSPLLQNYQTWLPLPTNNTNTSSALLPYAENYQIPPRPKETLSGGTALLANQAKCPFRAFAAHRLHAKPAPQLAEGMTNSQRGQLMHKVMELLWNQLHSQAHLLALSPLQLENLIEELMSKVLTSFTQTEKITLTPLSQDIEQARLTQLVHAALEWEKQRSPFVVEAIEQTFSLNLGGLEFKVRIDRLDCLAQQKKWVIDYKTTLPAVSPWNEARPEAPQLLLYALLDVEIEALIFIQLKGGRVVCSGLCETEVGIRGIRGLKKDEQWSTQLAQWQQQLTLLAEEFRQGHCPPTPTRISTCQQCDFPSLCRI